MRWGYNSKEKDLKFIELSAFLIGGKMILHGREVEIQVEDIEPFVNEKYKGFKILWTGSIGFGEYTIYKKIGEDKWYVDDEYMENPKNDRAFLRILFEDFTKQLEAEE